MERLPPYLPLVVAGEGVEEDFKARLLHIGYRLTGGRQARVVGANGDIEQLQRLVVFLMLRDKAGHGFLGIERTRFADATEDACAEYTDMTEELGVLQAHEERLSATHAKSGERPMLPVGDGPEVLVDEGNNHLGEFFLEATHTSPPASP